MKRGVAPRKGLVFWRGGMSYLEQLAGCLPKVADDALQSLPLCLISDGIQVHSPWGWGWSCGSHLAGGLPPIYLPHGLPS